MQTKEAGWENVRSQVKTLRQEIAKEIVGQDEIVVWQRDVIGTNVAGRANRRWAETLTWERHAGQQYQSYQEILGQV